MNNLIAIWRFNIWIELQFLSVFSGNTHNH